MCKRAILLQKTMIRGYDPSIVPPAESTEWEAQWVWEQAKIRTGHHHHTLQTKGQGHLNPSQQWTNFGAVDAENHGRASGSDYPPGVH